MVSIVQVLCCKQMTLLRDDEAQDLVEYALVVSLISVASLAILLNFSSPLIGIMNQVIQKLQAA